MRFWRWLTEVIEDEDGHPTIRLTKIILVIMWIDFGVLLGLLALLKMP